MELPIIDSIRSFKDGYSIIFSPEDDVSKDQVEIIALKHEQNECFEVSIKLCELTSILKTNSSINKLFHQMENNYIIYLDDGSIVETANLDGSECQKTCSILEKIAVICQNYFVFRNIK